MTRSFLFHPAVFYPLLALGALAIILLSLRPDLRPPPPAPVLGRAETGALTLGPDALLRPQADATQSFHIQRDGLGRPTALRIAVAPHTPPPGPADHGLLILLAPEAAAPLAGAPVRIEVTLRPLPITTASGLALSWQGETDEVVWNVQNLPPQGQTIAFDAPAQARPTAIGLRVISANHDYRYGWEIARIRVLRR